MIKLILNNGEYPNAFESHSGTTVPATNKQSFFEKKIISVINKSNNKLNIEKVEYQDLKSIFNLSQKKSAVIVKEDTHGQKVLAYIFLSPNTVESRNTLVSQSIFPDLINNIGQYIESSTSTMLNHPIYFLNMIDEKIEASSIIRDFSLLSASEFHYVELFEHSVIETKKVPKNIINFFESVYDEQGLDIQYFELDKTTKTLKILFPINDLLNEHKTEFKGSSEKFYWTRVVLASIIASNNGFHIDIEEYEDFIRNYSGVFSDTSKKMERSKILLQYLKKITMNFNKSIQKIYYGAPGTGKSYKIDDIIKDVDSDYTYRVTFHPEFSYSDFIGQLLPKVEINNGEKVISYAFSKGVFTQAIEKAYEDTSKDVYLILEEMSRGDVASIFGDIFQLLDREQKGALKGYSKYFVNNDIIAKDIIALPSNKVKLPPNLHILGTVNTSDQNVFVMDTAFKRRFDWEYINTNPVKDETGKTINNPDIKLVKPDKSDIDISWGKFYVGLNKFISHKDYLELGEDKQIGQFFIEFGNASSDLIKENIQNKLLQYLWSDVQKASYKNNISLFLPNISSFSDLHELFGKDEPVFSSDFFECIN